MRDSQCAMARSTRSRSAGVVSQATRARPARRAAVHDAAQHAGAAPGAARARLHRHVALPSRLRCPGRCRPRRSRAVHGAVAHAHFQRLDQLHENPGADRASGGTSSAIARCAWRKHWPGCAVSPAGRVTSPGDRTAIATSRGVAAASTARRATLPGVWTGIHGRGDVAGRHPQPGVRAARTHRRGGRPPSASGPEQSLQSASGSSKGAPRRASRPIPASNPAARTTRRWWPRRCACRRAAARCGRRRGDQVGGLAHPGRPACRGRAVRTDHDAHAAEGLAGLGVRMR